MLRLVLLSTDPSLGYLPTLVNKLWWVVMLNLGLGTSLISLRLQLRRSVTGKTIFSGSLIIRVSARGGAVAQLTLAMFEVGTVLNLRACSLRSPLGALARRRLPHGGWILCPGKQIWRLQSHREPDRL